MALRAFTFIFFLSAFLAETVISAASSEARVTSSSSKNLEVAITPAVVRWDTVRKDGITSMVPIMRASSEVLVQDYPNPIVVPAVRELISVPGANAWRVRECFVRCSIIQPNGQVSTIELRGSSNFSEESWSLIDPRIGIPIVTLTYLGQSGVQHIVRLTAICDQSNGQAMERVTCDSAYVSLEFLPPEKATTSLLPSDVFSHRLNSSTLNDTIALQWLCGTSTSELPVSDKRRTTNLQTSKKPVVFGDTTRPTTWYKVAIKESGVYRIPAEALTKQGIRLESVRASSVKVFGQGGLELPELPSMSIKNTLHEIPIIVSTGANGELKEVLFYASATRGFSYNKNSRRFEHRINHYDEQSYYYLTWGGSDGKRASEAPSASAPFINTPTQFVSRVFQEEELVNAYSGGSGRRWFGQQIDAVLPRTFATKLPGLVRNGNIEYVIDVAHKEVFSYDLKANVSIGENGSKLTDISLMGVNGPGYAEYVSTKKLATVSAQSINADGNSYLRFEYANPYVSGGGNAFLDFFEIHYPAVCSAIGDELTMHSDIGMTGSTRYSIGGFSSGTPLGFDVTDPSDPVLLRNTSSVGNIFEFSVNLDSTEPRTFYLSSRTRLAELSPVPWSYIRDEDCSSEVMVISADEFLESAQEFASYRAMKSGMSARVFPLSTIVQEFGSGIKDPTAIRDFISHAYRTWTVKPRYVVLWGDSHYDYKNISTQRVNYLPSWQTIETDDAFNSTTIGYYTSTYVTDDFFVRIVGDDEVTDLSVGRLPIDSRSTAQTIVDKIKHYENSSASDIWRTTATFVADDGPTSNGATDHDTHTGQSELLTSDTSCVPVDVIERKIYLPEYPAENIPKGKLKPRVTEDILSAVNNQGTLLLNWIGHGNPKVWAHETVLSRDVTIPQFTNYDKLFFLVAATCDFGRWDLPESQSGAELMVNSSRGGAIGSFSSSRVSFSTFNAIIGRAIFRRIFSRDADGNYSTLGEIVNAIKQIHSAENDQKYMLLGDPTLQLALPDLVASIDSINGVSTSQQLLAPIKALSTVQLSGSIRKFGTKEPLSTFNGAATISMFDSDVTRRFMDPSAFSIGDSTVFEIVKFGGTLHRGNYKVENGRFNARYVVPKDISFTNKSGRLLVYARSDDERHARGSNSNFYVGGIDTVDRNDEDGPEVNIYLDNTTFVAGDIVRKNPLLVVHLKDETGINSTGIGVGHKIEAWLDDSQESIDLSEYYVSSLVDSRQGSAIKQLFDLSPGVHTVRVRVWDVLNNYSEESTFFSVAANDSNLSSGRVLVFPNPFESTTTILFTHNQSFPLSVVANIYSLNGTRLRQESVKYSTLQSAAFVWDGCDESGNQLPAGVYPIVLHVTTSTGSMSTITALAVLRR